MYDTYCDDKSVNQLSSLTVVFHRIYIHDYITDKNLSLTIMYMLDPPYEHNEVNLFTC